MKKKKKMILIVSAIIISLAISAVALIKLYSFIYDVAEALSSVHGTWPSYYGIRVPDPTVEICAFSESGPFGEGEIYTICEYNDENFEKLTSMKIWSTFQSPDDIASICEYITTIKEKINSSDQLFKQYHLQVKEGYLYYLKLRDEGGFFLLIVNTDTKKLYALEDMV